MILLIDNYDSFSYNLYQLAGSIRPDIEVARNDALTISQIREKRPDAIILSPGPGKPADAGICEEIIREIGNGLPVIPVLGVCLGHQAICEAYGAAIVHAGQLMHGKQSRTVLAAGGSSGSLNHKAAAGSVVSGGNGNRAGERSLCESPLNSGLCESPLFKGLPGEITVARYHSLAVQEDTLPPCLAITARAEDSEIMAVQHRELPVFGLQFHPESIMTPGGPAILRNFLELAEKP